MPDHPSPFTRREFLYTGLGFVSTIASAPSFLMRSGQALAAANGQTSLPGVAQDRVLVVIQLSGGNDGLNTVVPFGQKAYYDGRPRLAVAEADALKIDAALVAARGQDGIGLHPALQGLHELLHDGQAAVIQGVGYPNPNRSHFASMDVWHAGDTRAAGSGTVAHGWIGRAMDAEHAARAQAGAEDHGMACVALGNEAPMATRGREVRPVTFERADAFRWAGGAIHDDLARTYQQLQQPPGRPGAAGRDAPRGADDATAFVFRTAMNAQAASDQVRQAVRRKSEVAYPGNGLAQQLRLVANMIKAELPTRVYYVAMGGFDTHAGQAYRHQNLLTQFSQTVTAFQRELSKTGHSKRVVTMAFSEFGRRVRQNASQGTDHGVAGPMFLFGEHVRPGLRGTHPSLTDLDKGDLVHTMDFRRVYADVLGNWLKIDPAAALPGNFPPAGVLSAKV